MIFKMNLTVLGSPITIDEFDILEIIWHGTYGKVKLAMKIIKKERKEKQRKYLQSNQKNR